MRSSQQQQQHQHKGNDSGIFSSLKSMANDLIGNSPSHQHQHQQHQQQPKRSAPTTTSHNSTPQINSNSSSTSKTQTLFPSYQTLQTALPQEIERVRSVIQNPNATISQLEQGDRALDDLVVLLSSQLAQLAELKRDNSKKLINKLKQQQQQQPTNDTVPLSPFMAKLPSPVDTPISSVPKTQTTTENKGFGALANRSNTTKQTTPTSGSAGNLLASSSTNKTVPQKPPTTSSNPLESMLDWEENETIVEPPKPKVKEQELFSMDDFNDTFTHGTVAVPPPTTQTFPDMLGGTNDTTQGADDILGFESLNNQPKEGAFLDEILGTEKSGEQGGVMIDFSDEGQKIYQSNQILSMFDKPAETATSSILDADDIPVVATTATVSSIDEFDF